MRPTKKQLDLLKRYTKHGAPFPTTKEACSTLINFLFYGERGPQNNCSARLALFRRWTGATVKVVRSNHRCRGRLGQVIGWRMRSKDEIAQLLKAPARTNSPFPFMAIVRLDRIDRPIAFSLSDLKVVNHGRQKLLFDLI
ncbi:MAG: hypothetical protein ABIH36_03995 [bacterium]